MSAADRSSAGDASSEDDAQSSVLLVEDTLEDALLVRTLLEKHFGFRITLAQDGIRGCQLAENQRWHLVVTDLNLPGRRGVEVVRASKEAFPDTPVLAITGYQEDTDAVESGADRVLAKPLDKDELLGAVAALEKIPRRTRASRGLEPDERVVLAIGGLPGDVELGCGGILLGQRAFGHHLSIFVLSAGGRKEHVAERRAEAERAAERLGAELVLPDEFGSEIPSQERMTRWTAEVIERVAPDILYTPSPRDVRSSRAHTHRAAATCGASVRRHYAYQSATTTLDFEPSLFVDIGEYFEGKLDLLSEYRTAPDFRPHLQPDIVTSSAEYWGRFLGYSVAEPLEVVES